ncbi:hypothetical protein KM043_005464 [Ampulex compressa]|nr:hypothetical protein KM043_005464 [Ampulex compressa]
MIPRFSAVNTVESFESRVTQRELRRSFGRSPPESPTTEYEDTTANSYLGSSFPQEQRLESVSRPSTKQGKSFRVVFMAFRGPARCRAANETKEKRREEEEEEEEEAAFRSGVKPSDSSCKITLSSGFHLVELVEIFLSVHRAAGRSDIDTSGFRGSHRGKRTILSHVECETGPRLAI